MRTFTAHTAKYHSNTDTKGKREKKMVKTKQLRVAIEKKS